MLPVIAIVGRPNVGKSTLFNRLTRSRKALVADVPGLTRDRLYAQAQYEKQRFIVIDTGGLAANLDHKVDELMQQQANQAIIEADIIFFIVDGRVGRTAADEVLANQLRQLKKPLFFIVNKTDGIDPTISLIEFHSLGFKTSYPISAEHGHNVNRLLDAVVPYFPKKTAQDNQPQGVKIAVIGRPNAGKSTLVNRILGEERVIVSEVAGTTRDSIYIPFKRHDKDYVIIDTAGVRRRGKVKVVIEKFSIVKTLQAIQDADVVIYLINARENIVEHDMKLLGFILEQGKALVVGFNKWDGLKESLKQSIKMNINRRLRFLNFVKFQFMSALYGTGVGDLFPAVEQAYQSATKNVSTAKLNQLLRSALQVHAPPLVRGRRVKLSYAHQGGKCPPVIVIHGNQTETLRDSYRQFLTNYFRTRLQLIGTPLRLQFKTAENPFKGKKNQLTARQQQKRKRLMRHAKDKK
ncbi:MAG: ribosome biogenesis GTPase Der [Pseudomonadota bacterium]